VLFSIFKSEQARVNSWNDKAVGNLGRGMRVSACSPDGVIEAIEADDDSFCLGVQFHPEYLLQGEVTDGYLSAGDIAKQHGIFFEMVSASNERDIHGLMSTVDSEIKLRAFAYHEANTEKLIHDAQHHGKLQLR
jgi:GMP synthase-like glutamine amidotransferase